MTPTTRQRSPFLLSAGWRAALGLGVAWLVAPTAARAQAVPDALENREPASSGSTEVAAEGFKKADAPPEEGKDATIFKLSAGGVWTAGNTRTVALTSAADFRLRRGKNQLKSLAAVNLARSAADADAKYKATVENYQALVRYDRFFVGGLAAFVSTSARKDRFQGLDLRLNVDPGVAYYFIDEKDVQLQTELGYDLQHDIRRQDYIDQAEADGTTIARSETRHSGRVFVGYDQRFSEFVSFDASVEYIQALKKTQNWRVNGGAALTSQIADRLSVATSVTVKYDANPLEGIETTDVFSAFSLVYKLE